MERLKVSLSPELRGRLEAAAAGSGKPLAEEVRSRAEWTLSLEPLDGPTRQLIEDIASMAAGLERECAAPWHSHPGTHAALRQALLAYLARRKPEGGLEFGERPHRTGPEDAPEEIGIWAEYDAWLHRDWTPASRLLARVEREKSWQEIVKLHQQREREGGNE